MEKIIIIGGGGHARVIKEILELQPRMYKILGYTDLKPVLSMKIKYLGEDSAVMEKFSPKKI
jgi:hypothetical protein